MAEHAHTTTPRRPLAAAVIAAAAVAFARPASSAIVTIGRPQDDGADAELIGVCGRGLDADRRAEMLTAPYYETVSGDPGHEGCDAAYDVAHRIIATEYHPSIARAAELPALSVKGLQAKARLLILQQRGEPEERAALAVSFARDVLAWRA